MANGTTHDELPPPHKKRRIVTGRSTNSFLRSWAWKREHRPDSVRFEQPYVHTLRVPDEAADRMLSIQQAPFNAEGFASTVWDSSIVVAKFLEKQAALATAAKNSSSSSSRAPGRQARDPAHNSTSQGCINGTFENGHAAGFGATEVQPPAAGCAAAIEGVSASAAEHHAAAAHPAAHTDAASRPAAASAALSGDPPVTATGAQEAELRSTSEPQQPDAGLSLQGKRCLDLSAGCGLVGIATALLGGCVTATDLSPNLPLLRTNCAANGVGQGANAVRVLEHTWGTDTSSLGPPFDLIIACDVMYIDDAVAPLVQTLAAASDENTRIYLAHGRNRQGEASFLAAAKAHFAVREVPSDDLDGVYQCTDVTMWRLTKTSWS